MKFVAIGLSPNGKFSAKYVEFKEPDGPFGKVPEECGFDADDDLIGFVEIGTDTPLVVLDDISVTLIDEENDNG